MWLIEGVQMDAGTVLVLAFIAMQTVILVAATWLNIRSNDRTATRNENAAWLIAESVKLYHERGTR